MKSPQNGNNDNCCVLECDTVQSVTYRRFGETYCFFRLETLPPDDGVIMILQMLLKVYQTIWRNITDKRSAHNLSSSQPFPTTCFPVNYPLQFSSRSPLQFHLVSVTTTLKKVKSESAGKEKRRGDREKERNQEWGEEKK
jgi:hypothetical protein